MLLLLRMMDFCCCCCCCYWEEGKERSSNIKKIWCVTTLRFIFPNTNDSINYLIKMLALKTKLGYYTYFSRGNSIVSGLKLISSIKTLTYFITMFLLTCFLSVCLSEWNFVIDFKLTSR